MNQTFFIRTTTMVKKKKLNLLKWIWQQTSEVAKTHAFEIKQKQNESLNQTQCSF
jgi:hypothetical protein